jgi:hypothetical protein
MVNYLANSTSKAFYFYSFCKVVNEPHWAWLYEDTHYCALMLSSEPRENCISDNVSEEQKQIDKGYVYPVMLRGSDNTSYIKRFKSKNQMFDWAFDVKKIDVCKDTTMLYYNS